MADYTFTQPIRYYKANDPYYYEVDNIPLRQLEENILYVKKLLDGTGSSSGSSGSGSGSGAGGLVTTSSELDLTLIKQLRPKSTGGRQVTVNAGVFNSRINDAFDIDKALFSLATDSTVPQSTPVIIPPMKDVFASSLRQTIFDRFTGAASAEKAYNINGLEFTYTFHLSPSTGVGSNYGWQPSTFSSGEGSGNYPHYKNVDPNNQHRWPGHNVLGPLAGQTLRMVAGSDQIIYEAQDLADIHQAFVKMWRGVFRTAVVDFPESTINIPEWNDEDFYYYDENENKITITADQRIDLLVAYSVPVDSSGAALQDYQSGFGNTGSSPSPKKITQPVLGLYKGAGIGITNNATSNVLGTSDGGRATDTPPAGSARIVGNVSDKNSDANQGITNRLGVKVHGSFPSPDDLLNIAPLIALDVDADDFQLVGQAALPLAYVVVKKDQTNITQDDIIDIRPFLRTTELTYNERAGVAGANPPLSFANPAVGAYQIQRAVDVLNTKIDSVEEVEKDGQALYTDYVMGGLAYGVEGTMLTMCDYTQTTTDPFGSESTTTYTNPETNTQYSLNFTSPKAFLESQDLTLREAYLQYIVEQRQGSLKRWLSDPNTGGLGGQSGSLTYLGLPQGNVGRNIPVFPEWDAPVDSNSLNQFFANTPKVSWWMHFDATTNNRGLAYAPGGVVSQNSSIANSHLSRLYGFGTGDEQMKAGYNVCSKKIQVTLPTWCNDYDVIVEYTNCSPITGMSTNDANIGTGGGLFVNKGPVYTDSGTGLRHAVFQINSMADNVNIEPGRDRSSFVQGDGDMLDTDSGTFESANSDQNKLYQFLSYSVVLPQFKQTNWDMQKQTVGVQNLRRLAPKTGASYYPTVKFTIVGYKSDTFTRNQAYAAGNKYSLIQNVINGQATTNLLGSQAPVTSPNQPSLIDIRSVT